MNYLRLYENIFNEPHRFYHNINHVYFLLDQIEKGEFTIEEKKILSYVAIFHDIVYNPRNKDNEKKSAEFAEKVLNIDRRKLDIVKECILDTSDHKNAKSKLSIDFCYLDLLPLLQGDKNTIIKNENLIFKEYQFNSVSQYKIGRKAFLQRFKSEFEDNYPQVVSNIDFLLDYIEKREYKVAIYPGSFNPFHIGHLSILEKAENVFDKVIIAIGSNSKKENNSGCDACFPDTTLYDLSHTLPFHEVIRFNGLLVDCVNSLEFDYKNKISVIRGLRNTYDLDYEMNYLRTLQDMKYDINIVYFLCDNDKTHISSSTIRELDGFNCEKTSKYLVKKYDYIKEK